MQNTKKMSKNQRRKANKQGKWEHYTNERHIQEQKTPIKADRPKTDQFVDMFIYGKKVRMNVLDFEFGPVSVGSVVTIDAHLRGYF